MDVFPAGNHFLELGNGDMDDIWNTAELMEACLPDTGLGGDWNPYTDDAPSVVLHDRMITEACNVPIKAEHSYCNLADKLPNSIKIEVDDMESECFPAISMQDAVNRDGVASAVVDVVTQPTPVTTPPPLQRSSTGGVKVATTQAVRHEVTAVPQSQQLAPAAPKRIIFSSHRDNGQQLRTADRPVPSQIRISSGNSLLKQHTIVLTTGKSTPVLSGSVNGVGFTSDYSPHTFSVKVEPSSGFHQPPTPPSSTDSDDSCSIGHSAAPPSPIRAVVHQRPPKVYITSGRSNYRTIATSLISAQPREYSGLALTEEEKRTLMAEGYPVPNRLPLSKSEEKSLKKIRRKIKNKISAQESRRKKKEYMDQMERRLDMLTAEKEEYRGRCDELEAVNNALSVKYSRLEQRNAQLIQQLSQLQMPIAPDIHLPDHIEGIHQSE